MITDIDIVNQALARISKGQISDFNDTRDTARNIEVIYNQEYESFLVSFPWSFARRRSLLARLYVDNHVLVDAGYRYAYRMPVDCLQVVRVHDGANGARERFIGRFVRRINYHGEDFDVLRYDERAPEALFTDMESVRILYVSRNTTVNNFSPDARAALISRIAYAVALTDQNSTQIAQQQDERYQREFAFAIKRDTRDENKVMPRDLYGRRRFLW